MKITVHYCQIIIHFYLDKGGWQYYFNVTNDTISKKLVSNLKLMRNLEDAMDFIVKTRFILDYAFLGSKISLTYLIQNNFIQKCVQIYN